MKPLAIALGLALVAILSGCAELTAGKAIALDTGAKAADTALEDALLVKCRISTVGAVQRHYMANDQSWKLWTEECLGAGVIELPAGPINILPQ